MTLDIVVVHYGPIGALLTSISSALAFAGSHANLIVVDNTRAGTAHKEIKRTWPTAICLANEQNVGFAAAVNQALRAGDGEAIMLLNPDVYDIKGSFAELESLLNETPRLGAIAGRLHNEDGSLQRNCRTSPRFFDLLSEAIALSDRVPSWGKAQRFRMLEWDYSNPREVDVASGAFLFLRRAALEDVGLFDERFFVYYEETDWLVRARSRGWKTLFNPAFEATHVGGESSGDARSVLPLLLLESQYQYSRKHLGRPSTALLRVLLFGFDLARLIRTVFRTKAGVSRKALMKRLRIHAGGSAEHPD